VDLFDKLDARRYDAMATADTANEFANLTDAQQEEHLGLWGFAGMDEAQHPLTALLREGHNDGCVIGISMEAWCSCGRSRRPRTAG